MSKHSRFYLVIAGFLLMMSLTGIVTAAGLAHTWKERPTADTSFSGVMFSADGSVVFAGGDQMLVRSWNGDTRWGGRSGTLAVMSTDGNYVISGISNHIQMLANNGSELWVRNTIAPVRAVAISANGSLIISADNSGSIRSWGVNDESWGAAQTDLVKRVAISPSGSNVVVTSEDGLKYFTPFLDQVWTDNKSGSLDSFIEISADGSTIITSGDNRVSSHTSSGKLTWRKDITSEPITDMACSDDCSTIVLGSQDGTVRVLNQLGMEQWKFSASSWINGVGVSRDGSVIAAGTLDRNLYILNKGGQILAQTKTDTSIQKQSVAVSRDGKRIAVADLGALYGFELLGVPEVTPRVTFTTSLPVYTVTSSIPVTTMTTLPVTIPSTKPTTRQATSSTPKSALNPCLAIFVLAGLLFMGIQRKN